MQDPFEELDPLEYWVEASMDGTIKEIYAVLGTGGPHIEVALYAGRVDGYWASEDWSAPVIDDEADRLLDELADERRQFWEENILA